MTKNFPRPIFDFMSRNVLLFAYIGAYKAPAGGRYDCPTHFSSGGRNKFLCLCNESQCGGAFADVGATGRSARIAMPYRKHDTHRRACSFFGQALCFALVCPNASHGPPCAGRRRYPRGGSYIDRCRCAVPRATMDIFFERREEKEKLCYNRGVKLEAMKGRARVALARRYAEGDGGCGRRISARPSRGN